MTGLEIALGTGLVLATIAAIRIWSALDDERSARQEWQWECSGLRGELQAAKEAHAKLKTEFDEVNAELYRHESNEAMRDLIRQRDKYQRQAIDLQLATNGLLAEREELFRELRRRAN